MSGSGILLPSLKTVSTIASRPGSPPAENPPISILGVPFDNLTTGDAVSLVEQMVASREPHYLVTANVDFLVQAIHDVELRRILFDAHLVLCDGTPLVWASRWLGNPLPERVAGADLAPLLIRLAVEKNYRIFFLGGAPEVAGRAVCNLQAQFPTLHVAGFYAPPFRDLLEMDHQDIVNRIQEARPDIVFVSFGCPKAEKWMAMHYRSLGVPVVVGVGAVIDFFAKRFRRAPRWMQVTGTEWLYRLMQEPRRLLKRYGNDLRYFSSAILEQWVRMRLCGAFVRRSGRNLLVLSQADWRRIQAPERFDAEVVRHDLRLWEEGLDRHCLLDLANVRFIDSTGLGVLIRLKKRLHAAGQELVLLSPSRAVLRALRSAQLQDFFAQAANAIEAREVINARIREQSPVIVNGAERPLAWKGEVTAINAEEVWQATEPRVRELLAQAVPVQIDLSELRFVDSTGVGIMVRAKKVALKQGGSLRFSQPHPNVQNVLRISRLEEFLLK